ncbi:hypothetical protein F5Y08DRAFT_5287 [Xylaria arbuscula]|nr:hypothetical protein F5Y08DRAFT_5287 [Xylaria arbuscula]
MPRPGFSEKATHSQCTPELDIQYSDASSTCWPQGWSFAKFRTATHEDVAALPVDELAKMQAGLREVLGEDGIGRLAQRIFQEQQQQKRLAEAESADEAERDSSLLLRQQSAPNWLKHWSRRRKGQIWGFVGFRATDQSRWREFEDELHGIVYLQLDRARGFRDFEDAKAMFEIRWIEDDEAVADADALRERYAKLRPEMPSGIAQHICLCATPGAVHSTLATDAANRPTAGSNWWRADAPYLVAVASYSDPGLEEGHEERDWFKPVFKVAIETLVEELWWLLDSDMTSLRRITRLTGACEEMGEQAKTHGDDLDDMWWTMSPSPSRMRKRRRFLTEETI